MAASDKTKVGRIWKTLLFCIIVALLIYFIPFLVSPNEGCYNALRTIVAICSLVPSVVISLLNFKQTKASLVSKCQRNWFYALSLVFLCLTMIVGTWRVVTGEPNDTIYLYGACVSIVGAYGYSLSTDISADDERVDLHLSTSESERRVTMRTVAIKNGSVRALVGACSDGDGCPEPIFWGTVSLGDKLTFKRVAFDSSDTDFTYSFAYRLTREPRLGNTQVPHVLLTNGESLERLQAAVDWFFPRMYPSDFTDPITGDSANPKVVSIMADGSFCDDRIVWLSIWEDAR